MQPWDRILRVETFDSEVQLLNKRIELDHQILARERLDGRKRDHIGVKERQDELAEEVNQGATSFLVFNCGVLLIR